MSSVTTELRVLDMSCAHCVATIESTLRANPGVEAVTADLEHGLVSVRYDAELASQPALAQAIEDQGYTVVPPADVR